VTQLNSGGTVSFNIDESKNIAESAPQKRLVGKISQAGRVFGADSVRSDGS